MIVPIFATIYDEETTMKYIMKGIRHHAKYSYLIPLCLINMPPIIQAFKTTNKSI